MTYSNRNSRPGRAGLTHLLGAALGLFLFGALAGGAPAIAQSAPKASGDLGTASSASARVVDMASVRTLNAAEAAGRKAPPHPRGTLNATQYEAAKAAAARAPATHAGQTGPAPIREIGKETPGATVVFAGQSEQGGIAPSDMALAVSQTWVVQVVNEVIAVYDKTGVLQAGFPKSLGTFVGGSGDNGDPRAFYDWSWNRFVVVVDDFTNGLTYVAASATPDPRGAWHVYSFNVWGTANCRTGACNDFPTTGFDDQTIYLGINFFPAAGGYSDFMLLLPKAKIYAGAGFSFRFWSNLSFGGILQDTIQPVTLLTGNEHPRAGFAVNSRNNFATNQCSSSACNGIVVWAFSNNLALVSPFPEISAVLVNTANNFTLPANANEPGCARCIDTNDPRISATPIYHDGKITAALETAGSDAGYHVLWFQVAPVLNDNDSRCTGAFLNRCPQVTGASMVNEDCFFCGGQGANGGSYFGALAPDIGGDLTMEYTFSDNSTFPESAYTSRRATQSANTMHDSGIVMCGGAAATSGRWGDYAATAGDISALGQNYQWFSGDNVLASGNWGSCIGRNGFTVVNQP